VGSPSAARTASTRPAAAIAQWGRYGFWRAQTLRRIRTSCAAAPDPAVRLGERRGAPSRILWPLVALLFLAYAAAVFAFRDRREDRRVTLASCFFFRRADRVGRSAAARARRAAR